MISALPGSVEAQVIRGSTVKYLLIAYFIGSISAKKYQNPFMCVKLWQAKGGTFSETRCISSTHANEIQQNGKNSTKYRV